MPSCEQVCLPGSTRTTDNPDNHSDNCPDNAGIAPFGACSEGRCESAWWLYVADLVVRYERIALTYLGYIHLRCLLILLRQGL
jgi:hypothetical protein